MHGRASLMESLVWSIPFLSVKRRERKRRERMKEKRREIEMKRNERKDEFFSKKCFRTLKPTR